MQDKEVGELWRECELYEEEFEIRLLIRKLVAERKQLYKLHGWRTGGTALIRDYTDEEAEQQALHDFSIDEATWPKS